MPIPELKTDNADFSNTLLKIRTMQQQDEQNRLLSGAKEVQNALVVHQQKKADAEAKKAWLENAGRQVSQLAILPDREMLNGYQAMYASDKEKNELGLPPMDVFANDKKEIDVEKVRTYLNRTAGIWTGKPGTSVKHIVRNDKADFEKPESLDNPYTLEVSGVYGDNGLFVANNASPVVNPFRVQEFKDKQEKRAQAALDETKRHNKESESTSKAHLKVAQDNSARQKMKEAEKKDDPDLVTYRVVGNVTNKGAIMQFNKKSKRDNQILREHGNWYEKIDKTYAEPDAETSTTSASTDTERANAAAAIKAGQDPAKVMALYKKRTGKDY